MWALAPYQGSARRMVLQWKNHTRADLRTFFAEAGRRAGAELAPLVASQVPAAASSLLVLPAPSGWRRRIRRRLVVADLAAAVGQGLRRELTAMVTVRDLLRTPDSSLHRLGAAGRLSSRRVHLRSRSKESIDTPVLLVDDVVTTGATLAACRRALSARGATVVGALVLAATPGPGSRTWR